MALNGARLSVLRRNSDDIIREVLIRTSQIKFGSEVNCTIRLKSELAEKLHCKVFVKNEKVYIANYSSKNPISVDGKVILKRAVLSDGCLLEMCRTRFRWKFDSTLLQARTDKIKKSEKTPTSSKFGKPRRTTIIRKKQNIEQAGPSLISNDRKSGPKKSHKTPTYTLPKNNKQLMKNMKKRFTMHSVMIDHNVDEDEEMDGEDQDQNKSAAMVSNIVHDATGTPKKLAPPDGSKNNTPFYTPDPEKENQTPAAISRTPKMLPLQLENSAMMILSYTPVAGISSKANVTKTPISSVKKAPHGRPSRFLTPKNDNIPTVPTTLNSPSVSKMGNSMYLIDLTTPTSINSSFVSNSTDQSFSSSAGLIDLVTPPSKKSKTPSSSLAKSSQKGLLRSALKNASKTPLSTLRARCATGTPKHNAMAHLDDSLSKSPNTSTKRIRTPLAIHCKTKTRSQMGTPHIKETINLSDPACSRDPQTPQEKNEQGGENETLKTPSVMTTDELFDTLVGRQPVKKTYSRKSDSPKKPPTSLILVESTSDLPKTDIDVWVESVVATVTSPQPLVAESFMKMPNRTTQVRSSQYSDVTPHESFTEVPVATEMLPTDESQEERSLSETSDIINENKLEIHDKPNLTRSHRSYTPLASKIVRSLGNKRQTIGNFFTNMFGKLTVSPVTRVSIPNANCDEVDVSSEHESENSEEEYHDSEANHVLDQSEDINPSPKLRQSLRDTRKFIGNALTSLNTSKLTLETSAEIDESLLLNETYDDNVAANDSEIVEENYDLTDLSSRPKTNVSSATVFDGHLKSASTRKSTRKVVHPDYRSEISPKEDNTALQSQRIVTRASTSVSTPSVRKLNRQSLDIDISPLAVPLQITPTKKSRKSIVPSAIKEQDISTFASDEIQQLSVTATNVGVTEKSKLSSSKQSSRNSIMHKSIYDIEGPTDDMMNLSTMSSVEQIDIDNTDERSIQTSETATPLRSRLSMCVSIPKSEQVASAEKSILDELSTTVDVSSVDHISNKSAPELITPCFGDETTHEDDETGNDVCTANNYSVHGYKMQQSTAAEVKTTRRSRSLTIKKNLSVMNMENSTLNQSTSVCYASKHTYRSRRATVSSSTPLRKNVEIKQSTPGLQMKTVYKRTTRKSFAATAISSPKVSHTTSTLSIESKLNREHQSLQELPTRFNNSIDDNVSSSPVNTLLETSTIKQSYTIQQTGNHSYISHSPNNTSPLSKEERIMNASDENEFNLEATGPDEYLEQSIVSETVSSTPFRKRRSSLRKTLTSKEGNNIERLSASMGKPVRKPSNDTPLLRKAFFAMCTPSRSSVTSIALQAATDQMIEEMTSANVDTNTKTTGRPSKRSTIRSKESTHRNIEIAVVSPNKDSEQELTPTETVTDSSLLFRTGSDISSAMPMLVGFEPDSSEAIPMLEETHNSINGQETNPDAFEIETSVDTHMLEETHDSIIGRGTNRDVLTPSKGERNSVDSPKIEPTAEKATMARISQRKSSSRMSTVGVHQSQVNADINSQNDCKVREIIENIQTPTINDLEQTSMSTKVMDKPETEPSVTQETAVSVKKRSTRKSLLRMTTDVTPCKDTSGISDNTLSVSEVMFTADHSSPTRVPHVTRKSVNVFHGVDSKGSASRHADKTATIEAQVAESISKQDAELTEGAVTTPLKDNSLMIELPSYAATIETDNLKFACRNLKSDVSKKLTISDGSVSLGSPRKQTEMPENMQESVETSPLVIHMSRTPATPVSVGFEQDIQVKTPASARKSLLTSPSSSKLTTMKQLSETIVEHQNMSIINHEVLTPTNKVGAISENLTDFEDEDKTHVQGSLKIGAEASPVSNTMVDMEHDIPNTAILNLAQTTENVEQVSMPSLVISSKTVTTPSSVTKPTLTRRRTASVRKSSSAAKRTTMEMSESMIKQRDESIEPEHLTSIKKSSAISEDALEHKQSIENASLVQTTPSRKPANKSKQSTPVRQNIVEEISNNGTTVEGFIIEQQDTLREKPEFNTPSKDAFVMTGYAADASNKTSTPANIISARKLRSLQRSTIGKRDSKHFSSDAEPDSVNKLAFSDVSINSSSKGMDMLSDNMLSSMTDSASIICTPRKSSNVRKVATTMSTPVEVDSKHDSQAETPASLRKSVLISHSTTMIAAIVRQPSEAIDELSNKSDPHKSAIINENVTAIENVSPVRKILPRKSTTEQKDSIPLRQDTGEQNTQNDTVVVNASIPIQSADLVSVMTEHTSSTETLTSINTHLMDTSIKTPSFVRKSSMTKASCSNSLIECNSPAFLKEQNYDSIVEQQDSIRREHAIFTPSKVPFINSENTPDTSKVVTRPTLVSRSTRRSTIVADDTVNIGSKSLLISRATDKLSTSLGQFSEQIVELSEVSKTGAEVFISTMETSINTGRDDALNIVASTPINVTSARASRYLRSTIDTSVPNLACLVTESDDFDEFVDSNVGNKSAPKQVEMSTGDLLTSTIDTQTTLSTENTPQIRNASLVRKSLLPIPKATTPVKNIKHLQEKQHESIDELLDKSISEHILHTPAKKTSAVEFETVESTPELTNMSYNAGYVSTPALDTIFKTPRPIRVARTSRAKVEQTATSAVKKMFSSESAEQETRSSNSDELDAGDLFDQRGIPSMDQDTNNRRSSRLSTFNNVKSPLAKDNAESTHSSSMLVSLSDSLPVVIDDKISAAPFVVEETPIKSIKPSASLSKVISNTSSIDVYPDLLKHLCERVITLEHELDTLADDSAENVTSSVIVHQSLDVTSVNCTLPEIPKLLETPAAISTIRKALRSSTVPEEQLSKTPIVKKLLRTSDNNSSPRANTVHSELGKTTQESADIQEEIKKLTETPIKLTVPRQKLNRSVAFDLGSCKQSTPNTTADLGNVMQLAKIPSAKSTTKKHLPKSASDTSIQLEGVEELMKTPTIISDASNRKDNSFVTMQGSSRRETRTSTGGIHSANSSSHLEKVQHLMMTPVTSSSSTTDTLTVESVQELLTTPSPNSSSKMILKPSTNPNSTDRQLRNKGDNQILRRHDISSSSKKVEELIKSPNSSCLEGVKQIFQTPTAPLTTCRSIRSGSKEERSKLDESSDDESRGTHSVTPRKDSAVDTSINLEGLEQLLNTPINSSTSVSTIDIRQSPRSASFAIKEDSTDINTSSNNMVEGIQKLLQNPVATSISAEQLVATKTSTLGKSIDLKEIQQLPNTPYDTSVDKKVDTDKSICLEDVRQLFKTPIAASVIKRNGKSVTTVVNPCNLDDSDAGIQNLMKTPEESSTYKKAIKEPNATKLNNTSLNDAMDMESTCAVHDNTATLNDIQMLLKTPISTRGNKSKLDSTANFEGLQSMLLTPMALSGIGKTDRMSTSAVEELAQRVSQSTSDAVITNEPISLESIAKMLESPAVVTSDKKLLKRALVNRIRETPSNTSTNMEGIQQLFATPTVISSTNNKKVSQEFPNDSHLEGIQELLKTPTSASVKKVEVSDIDIVAEISTPTITRLRRKLYTKNDPEDRTPESIKSADVHPVTSKDYLNILDPVSARDLKLGKKMSKSSSSSSDNSSKDASVLDSIRKNPSRVSKKNKSLAEEVLAGASPEMKYVTMKQPKIVEEPVPFEIMATTSSKYDTDSKDSQLRRKVMFNENLQIKEINSPAPVGDIILKVSRGRGRTAHKVVRVIVDEASEQSTIKPARRTAGQDTDKQPIAEFVDVNVNTVAKPPRRGNKRAIDTIEVSNFNPVDVTVGSTGNIMNEDVKDGSVPGTCVKIEAEPVMKRPRRAATKSNLEAKKTSTTVKPKQLESETIDDVEGLHDESFISVDQAIFPVNKRSQRKPQKNIISPKKSKQDVQTVSKTVLNEPAGEQVTEVFSGRNRRGAKKSNTNSNRAKSSKMNVSNEQSATDAENVAEISTSVQKSVSTNTIELKEECDAPVEPVQENVAPERTKRATAAKSRQRKVVAGQKVTSDTVSSSTSKHEEQIHDTILLQIPIATEPVEEKAAPDHMKRETVAKGRQRRAATNRTKTSDAVPSHSSTQIQELGRILGLPTLPTSIDEEPAQERVAPEYTKQETVVKGRQRRAATRQTETLDAVSSSASTQIQDKHIRDTSKVQTPVAEKPVVQPVAPEYTKQETVGKGRRRRAATSKTETSDAVTSSVSKQIQDNYILDTPVTEKPVVEQAAADSTSHDEPDPIPVKRGNGRYTRNPKPNTTDKRTTSIKEASPMAPPPLSIIPRKNESSDKLTLKLAPASRGRKKLVAQLENQQEMQTTEESLNESHMIRTMLPATHTSTPLMESNQDNTKATRGGGRKLANPAVAALIAEEYTPNRRSPRSRRVESENSIQDSHNAKDAEEPKIKRTRTLTASKMKLNDDSKDHPAIKENITTAIEQSTEDDTTKVKKLSRASAKRGRGKNQTDTEREVVKEATKRIRKQPAKLQVSDSDYVPSSNYTNNETVNTDPEQLSLRSQRGGKKQAKQKSYPPTTFDESNDNNKAELSDVQKKPASKRPATRKKIANIEKEESEDDVVIIQRAAQKQIQDDQPVVIDNTTATANRRRPLRSRK